MPRRSGVEPARTAIIIPARLNSTRLPRKLLLRDTGKSIIRHTYESASQSTLAQLVCVATDSEEIAQSVRDFGGNAVMTRSDHVCGSDRIAEVAESYPDLDIIVNVQGDEPEIAGQSIDQVITLLGGDPASVMSTLAAPIRSRERLCDPSCVKVTFNKAGHALYFSRSPIPCAREWDDALLSTVVPNFFQHIGIYAYRRDFLLTYRDLTRSPLEAIENLEQLRVLYAGYHITVGVTDRITRGIDTPEDYDNFVCRMKETAEDPTK